MSSAFDLPPDPTSSDDGDWLCPDAIRPDAIRPDTAVILAGGLGTRLREAVADRPKVLAPVAGRPFLDYLIGNLKTQGVRLVILSVGYLADQVQSYAGCGERWGIDIQYSYEQAPLGTGGAMRLASQSLDRPFIGLNGDSFSRITLIDLWHQHQAARVSATIALREVASTAEDNSLRGCVRVDARSKILAFEEKPESLCGSSAQGKVLINTGVYLLNPDVLDDLEPDKPASLERDVFPMLAARGDLAAYIHSGYFMDIGTPSSLATFESDVTSGRIQAAF
jgi:NDP-sugar pyrophosphorylase family protein